MADTSHDLPNWWEGREFEHRAEVQALSVLLSQIYKRKSILDIGAGFGRLTPIYAPFFSKIVLVDPSRRLLALAENYVGEVRGAEFINGSAEELPVQSDFFDVALCVHIIDVLESPTKAISEISRVLQDNGYLILELPTSQAKTVLVHLKSSGFEIARVLSVNNIRLNLLKKVLPPTLLLRLESKLQTLFSKHSIGQSIFVLAQKISGLSEESGSPLRPLSFKNDST